jgi:dolichol-phosphate mannosyltransferase
MSNEVELSVVVPVKNEADNIEPLVTEIVAALTGVTPFEIVYVDDGSTDATADRVAQLAVRVHQLRLIRHAASCGQSAAVRSGILAARGSLIATLDGDGQNDPADLPRLLATLKNPASAMPVAMVAGQRVKRQDSKVKLVSSRIANKVRRSILNDDTPDTGCGIKLFSREAYLRLPYFDHMHRFLPALMKREGYLVGREPVNHRQRLRGTSKYGINNRLWVGIVDLAGVWWLMKRRRSTTVTETVLPR